MDATDKAILSFVAQCKDQYVSMCEMKIRLTFRCTV
jgi:hypothetical protein